MSGHRDDKKRWQFFQAGADSLAAYGLLPTANRYVCPQCILTYIPEAVDARVLTLEHVPPRKVGGKNITLTCSDCNPRAGTRLDAAMFAEKRLEDFARGGPGRWKARLVTDDPRGAAVTIDRNADRAEIVGHEKLSHPDAHKATFGYFDKVGRSNWQISLRFRGYNPRHAAVGHLRAAYLAAFALFGYAMVLTPLGARIRKQISEPDTDVLGGFLAMTDEPVDPSVRALAVCDRPFPCLAVQMGRRVVILPWPPSGIDPYELLGKQKIEGAGFDGQLWSWPKGMELLLDKETVAQRGPLPGTGNAA